MSIRILSYAGLSALVMMMGIACDTGPSVPVEQRRVIPLGRDGTADRSGPHPELNQPGTMASQAPVPIAPPRNVNPNTAPAETGGAAVGRTQ